MMEPICDPNPCSITGSMVTISENAPDSNCIYTATATCTLTFSEIQFNSVPPGYSFPQSLTCDTATSQYTYIDGGGVQQQINAIDCICKANPCPTLTGSMVTVSAPTVDASCTYTATSTCNNPYPRVIQFSIMVVE
uniref:Uncharacterized protein n=1 Tax=Panagrolaimus superbus TaxID=310955 RepID=A0A914XY90_9BILA